MNSITRKLVLSILTVVLTVVALGTTTFAWFTLTNTAVVQPFQAQITADTGIEIALGTPVAGEEDELNWVTTLTTQAITDYIAAQYPAFRFSHVTTANGTSFNTLGATAMTPAPASSYLSIPINFRSSSATSINWTSVTLSNLAQTWQSDAAFIDAEGNPLTSGDVVTINASDSFRIAILGTISGLSSVIAYENPYDITNFPTNVVLDGDGAVQNLANGVALGEGNPGAMNYYYEKSNILPWGANAVTVLDTIQTLANNPIVTLLPTPTAGATNYGQVIIRIWLEGWDANAYNSILNQVISVSLQFTGV